MGPQIATHLMNIDEGRGLAAIHDGRLRAELRTAAGHTAVALEVHQRTPDRSGAGVGVGDGERPTSATRGERPPRRRWAERGEQARGLRQASEPRPRVRSHLGAE
ncbi:hypothetical protein NDU88_005779 [Pleurodeles waltl]|uniref:Uncharacterized protein n=1 Tax=Pleurodeles waltl TaxID=8319 RepID=A0AAV7RMP2_PLEWA|nr:hypothetical protein NDU88_005779 [Pleurodeles waltl]